MARKPRNECGYAAVAAHHDDMPTEKPPTVCSDWWTGDISRMSIPRLLYSNGTALYKSLSSPVSR